MNTSLADWLDRYAVSHQNPTNKRIHHICVPLIFMSIVGMLYNFHEQAANILVVAFAVFYIRLGTKALLVYVGLVMVSLLVVKLLALTNPILLLVFILAWIGQFIGHKIEGAKPSFFEDLQFLLIGPLWVFARVL